MKVRIDVQEAHIHDLALRSPPWYKTPWERYSGTVIQIVDQFSINEKKEKEKEKRSN